MNRNPRSFGAPALSILFICTGNIFRSMTAEYALRATPGLTPGTRVHSAGLAAAPHEIVPYVEDYLARRQIDISRHRPKVVTPADLDAADLAVAMGLEHRALVLQTFDRRLPLFSEVAYGTEEPLPDVCDVVPDWRNNEATSTRHAWSVMDYLFDGMPAFVSRMPGFMRAR